MRYTKFALLMFGVGLVLGLAAIAIEIGWLERPASFLMALAIAALPIAMAIDWRRATRTPRPQRKNRGKVRPRRAIPAARRVQKPGSRKR